MSMPLGFNSNFKGGTFTSIAGIEFDFHPSIAMSAKKVFELEASIKSFRVPLETSIREVMRPSIKTNFAVGGRPQWLPLADSTEKRKGNGKVLVETGKLSRVASQRNIWDIGRYTAVIKGGKLLSDVPYALYMQGGTSGKAIELTNVLTGRKKTTYGGGASPARPYLMIQEEDKAKIRTIFSEWLAMRIAQKWGS